MLSESLVGGGCEYQSGIFRREWGFELWLLRQAQAYILNIPVAWRGEHQNGIGHGIDFGLWLLRQAHAYILDIPVAGRREHQNGIDHGVSFGTVAIETGTRLHI